MKDSTLARLVAKARTRHAEAERRAKVSPFAVVGRHVVSGAGDADVALIEEAEVWRGNEYVASLRRDWNRVELDEVWIDCGESPVVTWTEVMDGVVPVVMVAFPNLTMIEVDYGGRLEQIDEC